LAIFRAELGTAATDFLLACRAAVALRWIATNVPPKSVVTARNVTDHSSACASAQDEALPFGEAEKGLRGGGVLLPGKALAKEEDAYKVSAIHYDVGAVDPNIQVVGAALKATGRSLEHRIHCAVPLHYGVEELVAARVEQLWGHDLMLEEAAD
jgi:hypothetical protein